MSLRSIVHCRPATQFCCGCTVTFGVKAILILHFLRNVYFLLVAVMTMVFKNDHFQYSGSLALQTAFAGLALAGLPIILLAWWSVQTKTEGPLRLYGYYLLLDFLIDMWFVAKEFIISGACVKIPSFMLTNGAAFACGFARGASAVAVVSIISIECYLAFIVFSHCEDLATSGGPDLMDIVGPAVARKRQLEQHRHVSHMANTMTGDYGCAYERALAGGLGGSKPIFGSHFYETFGDAFGENYHELEYPPHRLD